MDGTGWQQRGKRGGRHYINHNVTQEKTRVPHGQTSSKGQPFTSRRLSRTSYGTTNEQGYSIKQAAAQITWGIESGVSFTNHLGSLASTFHGFSVGCDDACPVTGGNAPRYISHAARWRAQEARSTFVADCTLGRQRMPAGTVSNVYPTCTNLMYLVYIPSRRISLPILYCNAYHVPSTSYILSTQTLTTMHGSHVQTRDYTCQRSCSFHIC